VATGTTSRIPRLKSAILSSVAFEERPTCCLKMAIAWPFVTIGVAAAAGTGAAVAQPPPLAAAGIK